MNFAEINANLYRKISIFHHKNKYPSKIKKKFLGKNKIKILSRDECALIYIGLGGWWHVAVCCGVCLVLALPYFIGIK